jgi:hypothetical protein
VRVIPRAHTAAAILSGSEDGGPLSLIGIENLQKYNGKPTLGQIINLSPETNRKRCIFLPKLAADFEILVNYRQASSWRELSLPAMPMRCNWQYNSQSYEL